MEQLQLGVYQAGQSVQEVRNLSCVVFWEATVSISKMRSSSAVPCERLTSHPSCPLGTDEPLLSELLVLSL